MNDSLFPGHPLPRNNDLGEIVQEDPEEAFKEAAERQLKLIERRVDVDLPVGRHIRAFYKWVTKMYSRGL